MNSSFLKIIFFTPYYHQNRGNSTTARRIQQGLTERGVQVYVFAYEEEPFTSEIQKKIDEADVLHILQFARFAKWSDKHSFSLTKPYIVTSGGTDINHSLEQDEEKYMPLLNGAKAITVFADDAKKHLTEQNGLKEEFIHVIPQGVYFPEHCISKKEQVSLPEGNPKILLVAGLRPVKDVLYALPSLKELKADFPDTVFLILGANLDDNVYERVQQACKNYDWIFYRSEIELSAMKEVYSWADIVINTSISEGQPTSLIEAMNEQKPVVARENTGNSSIIRHGINGMLFSDHNGLYHSLKKLQTDEPFYLQIGLNGYQTVKENHTIEKEINAFIKLYKQ